MEIQEASPGTSATATAIRGLSGRLREVGGGVVLAERQEAPARLDLVVAARSFRILAL
jgi:hypothetical protein